MAIVDDHELVRNLEEAQSDEPSPPQLALGKSILILAATLRELIASYRTVTCRLLRDD